MQEIYLVDKPLGWTPLEAILELKKQRQELTDTPVTYAGRLDPMASGLLLLLSGNAIKRKQEFLDLPKTYYATIMFGFASDSFDALGMVTKSNVDVDVTIPNLLSATHSLVGNYTLPLPAYSLGSRER